MKALVFSVNDIDNRTVKTIDGKLDFRLKKNSNVKEIDINEGKYEFKFEINNASI